MPGKVVQALKKVQTENPLILIDEGIVSEFHWLIVLLHKLLIIRFASNANS